MIERNRAGGEDPLDQSELATLEAELRAARQQHAAALERVRETQAEIQALMERARALLARGKGDRA
jgi:hypothetical protein